MSDHHLTVGELRKTLEGLPDHTPVYYERIEDVYFEKHNWPIRAVPDPHHPADPNFYIRAFTSFLAHDRSAFYITAHY